MNWEQLLRQLASGYVVRVQDNRWRMFSATGQPTTMVVLPAAILIARLIGAVRVEGDRVVLVNPLTADEAKVIFEPKY